MQHHIPKSTGGARHEAMSDAIESCVHCGFCLPACPTYVTLEEEMNSPRGRILLMKNVLEGDLPLAEATPYLDPCLGCVACVSACPSGVAYGELITGFRLETETQRDRPLMDTFVRKLVLETLPYPKRFRLAVQSAGLGKSIKGLLPEQLKTMLELVPERLPKAQPLPDVFPAKGKKRARVALLAGCAQQVLDPGINWATLRVLAENGVETVIPKQGCCGALSAHTGANAQAKQFAKNNLNAFPDDVDAIITNAAGCGSGMHEYALWLAGEPEEAQARAFSKRVKDISVFLSELGIIPPNALNKPLRVAYHDACHLAHAQGVTLPPRDLLQQIPGLELLELEDSLCCGSAGTYNLEQPDIAAQLGERKALAVLASGAMAVATGNIGCMTQLSAHLLKQGKPLPVYHTVQLLDRAYRQA